MIVAIPSKGRANKVKSLDVIPSATVFCPELEVSAYRACGARNVIGVPDDVRGITRTRNWILENVADPYVVMIDDDVKAAGWLRFSSFKTKHEKMSEAVWLREFEKLFELTEDLGYRIWGIATQSAPRSVYPYRPLLWRSYVTASCMGILRESGIRFDESFAVKEDYEICLRCMKEDGGVVAARYFYWENSHWSDAGGCADYRTQAMELDAIERLQKLYPGMIRRITRGGSEYSISLEF